jgi:uncharacterized protein DUF559
MAEARKLCPTCRDKSAQLLAADLADDQWGVIGLGQLRACGVARSTASRWRANKRLHLVHPAVYAFGHRSIPIEGHLVAALLYAGRDAVLSHATAAWWWGLVPDPPGTIELSAPRRVAPSEGVVVHHRSQIDRTRHRRFPITSVAQTLLDYAAEAELLAVRKVLAQADYLRLLDVHAVERAFGQGRPGTAKLRDALARYRPSLARTRSWLEAAFLPLCEAAGIPLPEVNVRVAGWTVDALWREQRLIVELDGYDNHSTRAQMQRDRQKDLELRAAGFIVIRYAWHQIVERPDLVAADLLAALAARSDLVTPDLLASLAERRDDLSSTVPLALGGSR